MRAGLAGLDGFMIREETPDGPDPAARGLPVAGLGHRPGARPRCSTPASPADDPTRAARDATGCWPSRSTAAATGRCAGPTSPPAGWAFEFANDDYPDTDDTAEIVLASAPRRASRPGAAAQPPWIGRVEWTAGMQSRDGGWAAFDADNTRTLATKLPFCDFGAVIDPPSADVTAHVVEMLAARGPRRCRPGPPRGATGCWRHQEADGSWFGRWGANHVYGTGAVVPALIQAGLDPDAPPIRARGRLAGAATEPDGGWGEDLRSYGDPEWIGRGTSTAVADRVGAARTARRRRDVLRCRATPASAGSCDDPAPDGGWDEAHYTGTGFPGDFYIYYHLYRLVFPVWALGRYVRSLS